MSYAEPIFVDVRLPLPKSMRASRDPLKREEAKRAKQRLFAEAERMLAIYRGKVDGERRHEIKVKIHCQLEHANGKLMRKDPHNLMAAILDAVAKGLDVDDKIFQGRSICEGYHDTRDEYALVSVGRMG